MIQPTNDHQELVQYARDMLAKLLWDRHQSPDRYRGTGSWNRILAKVDLVLKRIVDMEVETVQPALTAMKEYLAVCLGVVQHESYEGYSCYRDYTEKVEELVNLELWYDASRLNVPQPVASRRVTMFHRLSYLVQEVHHSNQRVINPETLGSAWTYVNNLVKLQGYVSQVSKSL